MEGCEANGRERLDGKISGRDHAGEPDAAEANALWNTIPSDQAVMRTKACQVSNLCSQSENV